MSLPENLRDTDDVAVAHVAPGVVVHKPGDVVTGCGEPMWAMQHPLPSAGYLAAYCPAWCEQCWPRESTWERMLTLAYPSRFRTAQTNSRSSGYVNRAYASDVSAVNERGGR